jgi:hypothetical protein
VRSHPDKEDPNGMHKQDINQAAADSEKGVTVKPVIRMQ